MAELQTSFPLDKQPTLLDLMQQSQRVTGLKNLNLGAARQFQSEDAQAAKMAQLAQIRSQFTNPQTGQVDRAGYQGALNMSGMGSEADADQAGQYEMQQKKLESTVKAIDFSSRILGAAADHPEYRQQAVDLVYQISESIGGKKPDITADDPPEKFKYFAAQGLSYKDKLQMDFDMQKQKQAQGNFEATLNETKRAHDLTAQNSGWVQTVGKDGLPVWTQGKYEGMPAVDNKTQVNINGRPLPATVIDKFTKAQSAVEMAKGFEGSFKDEYAGQPIIGSAANAAGNVFGDDSGQSSWWKNYQANKNETRNALFGGALTPTEKAEYDKQDISPGMEAGEVRKKLKRQSELAEVGYSRIVKNYGKGGFNTEEFNVNEDDGLINSITKFNKRRNNKTGQVEVLKDGAWVPQ